MCKLFTHCIDERKRDVHVSDCICRNTLRSLLIGSSAHSIKKYGFIVLSSLFEMLNGCTQFRKLDCCVSPPEMKKVSIENYLDWRMLRWDMEKFTSISKWHEINQVPVGGKKFFLLMLRVSTRDVYWHNLMTCLLNLFWNNLDIFTSSMDKSENQLQNWLQIKLSQSILIFYFFLFQHILSCDLSIAGNTPLW